MESKDNLIKVFFGVEATALLLKGLLEEAGISVLMKNDSASAFLGVLPQEFDLYIQEMDFVDAEPIITDFVRNCEK
jgi:hypothetical protein